MQLLTFATRERTLLATHRIMYKERTQKLSEIEKHGDKNSWIREPERSTVHNASAHDKEAPVTPVRGRGDTKQGALYLWATTGNLQLQSRWFTKRAKENARGDTVQRNAHAVHHHRAGTHPQPTEISKQVNVILESKTSCRVSSSKRVRQRSELRFSATRREIARETTPGRTLTNHRAPIRPKPKGQGEPESCSEKRGAAFSNIVHSGNDHQRGTSKKSSSRTDTFGCVMFAKKTHTHTHTPLNVFRTRQKHEIKSQLSTTLLITVQAGQSTRRKKPAKPRAS